MFLRVGISLVSVVQLALALVNLASGRGVLLELFIWVPLVCLNIVILTSRFLPPMLWWPRCGRARLQEQAGGKIVREERWTPLSRPKKCFP